MQSLYLPRHDAFLRWTSIGSEGPLLVWLPGLGMPSLGNLLETATDECLPPIRSVFVDFPGMGASDPFIEPLDSIWGLAETVADLLDHLGAKAATIVGYSMGGSVGIALALLRPDLVARLVLAEANLLPGGGAASRHIASVPAQVFAEEVLPQMIAGLRDGARGGDVVDAFIAGAWTMADATALHAAARALVDLPMDFQNRFLALPIPRSFIFGSKSLPAPGAAPAADAPDADVLRAAGVEVLVQHGVGHEMMIADTTGFSRLVAAAMKDAPG